MTLFFTILFNHWAAVSTQILLFLRLPAEEVTINYLLPTMVQGSLTHQILVNFFNIFITRVRGLQPQFLDF